MPSYPLLDEHIIVKRATVSNQDANADGPPTVVLTDRYTGTSVMSNPPPVQKLSREQSKNSVAPPSNVDDESLGSYKQNKFLEKWSAERVK